MEIVHARCAGLDMSKKDAKVCVRIAGAGRRRTLETVTIWSAMTNQVLTWRNALSERCSDGPGTASTATELHLTLSTGSN